MTSCNHHNNKGEWTITVDEYKHENKVVKTIYACSQCRADVTLKIMEGVK